MAEQSAIVGGKFACPACGKRYAWKAQLAGRKAKCACGASVVVPQATEPKPAAEDDLYDVVEVAPVPVKRVAPPVVVRLSTPATTPQVAAPAPAPGCGGAVMGYVTPRRFDDQTKSRRWRDRSQDLLHPPRDIYLPAGLVVAGFLGMLAWATLAADVGPFGVVLVGMATGFATAIKTVALVSMALVAAPMFGLSFGTFRTAIGKFAAVIIFTDMTLLWLGVATDHMAGPTGGSGARGTGMFVTLLLAVALVGFLVRFLFDMDVDETAVVSLPLALASLVLGFILKVLAFVVLMLLLGASRGGSARVAPTFAMGPGAGVGAGGGTAADEDEIDDEDSAAETSVQVRPTEQDRKITARVRRGIGLAEARDWSGEHASDTRRQRLAEVFYAAGARKVYFDLTAGGTSRPTRGFVELPQDASGRADCIRAYKSYCATNRITPDPPSVKDVGQRYLMIEMKR
jgi:hypothetical protein